PGRRFLNVYGPTEATVTATWTVLSPDRPVTIGRPLPTYSVVVLDPEDPGRVLPCGEPGELGIAGVGLARGYLNRDDLTEKVFVPDPLGVADNPSGRIYRTGDLGRINADGEIEYLGRIDLQVKIRGYRIELTEIESVLLRVPGIAAAVVDTFEPAQGGTELVGYYSVRAGVDELDPEAIYAQLREQLPGYMVPAYLQRLDRIPLTNSDKVDRAALPAPTVDRGGCAGGYVAPANHAEGLLADALAEVLGVEKVSTHSHFFDDLNANSLLMAHYSAQIRRETALGSPSMRDIYQNPTVHQLAAVLSATPRTQAPVGGPGSDADPPVLVRTSSVKYVATGAVQLLCFLGVIYLGALLVDVGFSWSVGGVTPQWVFSRSAAFAAALLLAACLLPIPAKWLLIGRWKEREINLWSLAYLRFWTVRTLMAVNPLQLFTGSPIYPLYLRALGAKIGKGVTILSAAAPVTTDLISIGAGTVIRQGSSLTGYHATNGKLRFGPVRLGEDVFIGQASVLDIHTSVG
ncbi:MAG: AMP-binding protein, partial [Pseudonocardia sp.]|nr:AMP-binding protein [Pseudonocardia sp.]